MYDKVFLALLSFQYFNQGAKALLLLAVKDYFKTTLDLDPSRMAQLQSFISLPWSVKLLYGLLSDNLPLCGSRRKSYVVLMGLLQFLSLWCVFAFEVQNAMAVAGLLFVTSLTGAYLDVLVDALMVTQSR